MTQLEYLVEALKNLGGKAGIRKNIEDHSSDSMNYKGKEDIFYSVGGIGSGEWGLRKK